MSRMNAIIKLSFWTVQLIFLILILILVITSAIIASGRVVALAFPLAKDTAIEVLILSTIVLACMCVGCCGSLRQTIRKGCFSGRKMLCMNQLILIGGFVFSIAQFEWLKNHQQIMKLVISDPESHPIYFGFELRFSEYFNKAYFESLCSEDPSSAFILKYVDNMCPQSMSQSQCALSEIKKELCDTTCHAVKDKDDASDAEWLNCCPSEEECDNGNLAGCPFHRCRVEILKNFYKWAKPMKIAAIFICVFTFILLILSCLLICYQERDAIEELVRIGALTEQDAERMRRYRDQRLERERVKNEQLKKVEVENRPKVGDRQRGRKRINRVSPTPSEP
mmetsp:Transcript_3286/g.7413  ORF Transcript_3286/g.7413 Transcript_3286/m.7413 type:complete len:337 (+) Transcript_3286:152-1162(+)